jgi:hypothetical protein
MPVYYLASPYTHPDAAIREWRFNAACEAAAALMRRGYVVFSPIAHGHPISRYGLPGDWSFWQEHCRSMLVRMDELLVLTLDGWEESEGVNAELRMAGEFGIVVTYVSCTGEGEVCLSFRPAGETCLPK